MLNETIESNALESIIYFEKVFDFLIFSANRTVKKSIIFYIIYIQLQFDSDVLSQNIFNMHSPIHPC